MAKLGIEDGNCKGKTRTHKFSLDIIPGLAGKSDAELERLGRSSNGCDECLVPECAKEVAISRESTRISLTVKPRLR